MRVLLDTRFMIASSPLGMVSSKQTSMTANMMAPPVSAVRSLLRPEMARPDADRSWRRAGRTGGRMAGRQPNGFRGAAGGFTLKKHAFVEMVGFVDEAQGRGDRESPSPRLPEVGPQLSQQRQHRLGVARVEVARGLVRTMMSGIGDDGACDRHPLLLPAGQRAWRVLGSLLQSDDPQRPSRRGGGARACREG